MKPRRTKPLLERNKQQRRPSEVKLKQIIRSSTPACRPGPASFKACPLSGFGYVVGPLSSLIPEAGGTDRPSPRVEAISKYLAPSLSRFKSQGCLRSSVSCGREDRILEGHLITVLEIALSVLPKNQASPC